MPWTLSETEHADELASICGGLADPKRVKLLAALRGAEHSVGELSEIVGATQPSVSHHLGVLRSKGLVSVRRSGTRAYYRQVSPRVTEALDTLFGVMMGTEEPQPVAQIRSGPPAPPPPRRS